MPASIPDQGTDAGDIALVRQLADTVGAVARQIDPATCASPPYVVRHTTDAGYLRRVVLYHRPDYLLQRACTFVGFLGKKRPLLSASLVSDMVTADERLMDEFVGHADLLGYASVELADRNWGNLVLFRHPDAVAVVHQKDTHRHAARELAPHYYEWIHLYHGSLPGGVARDAPELTVTKSQQFSFATAERVALT